MITFNCIVFLGVIVFFFSPADAMMNLERLVSGHLYLTPVITMFTNSSYLPSCEVMVNAVVKVGVCMYVLYLASDTSCTLL